MRRAVWQAEVRQEISVAKGMAQSGYDPYSDFGFDHPIDVVAEGAYWLREWHILPVGGGWMEQDPILMNDILRYIALQNSLNEVKPEQFETKGALTRER